MVQWTLKRLATSTLRGGTVALCLIVVLLLARQNGSPGAEQLHSRARVITSLPRGRWRLAPHLLNRVVLRVSHIVVGYADSPAGPSAWSRPGLPSEPRPKRSRQQARVWAERLADDLQQQPRAFAEAARSHSDDRLTAAFGGALGTVLAASLSAPTLDVLAQLRPGEVSAPLETSAGFRIFKLEATPPNEPLAARRIVVSYRGCVGAMRAGRSADRERAIALQLANRIVHEARAAATPFGDLVEKYTDSADIQQGGDFGRWFTHEPLGAALLLEALRRAEMGGVSEPIDTPEGFQILQRTAASPRAMFAASYLWLHFQTPSERTEAQRKLSTILDTLRKDARQFEDLQRSLCCSRPSTWSAGRAPVPEVQKRLENLAIGELSLEPIEAPDGFYLVKRLAPPLGEGAPEDVLTELPHPIRPDLREVLPLSDPNSLKLMVRRLGEESDHLKLSKVARDYLDKSLSVLAEELAHVEPSGRIELIDRFWSHLPLSGSDLKRFREFVDREIAREMLGA